MKKRIAILGIFVGTVAALTACGGNKYVTTLGAYKGVAVTVEPKEEVTQEGIDAYIEQVLNAKATFEEADKAIEEGDQVNINYVGKKDGKEFEGGSSAEGGYDLVIGSHRLIDGFEEGLIGAKKGDTLDLNLTFPETYSATELAGQDVVFTVTVNTVKESVVPELTDDYVTTLQEDCKTVDEYKEYIKGLLEDKAQYAYDQAVQEAAFEVVFNESVVSEPDQELIDSYYDKSISQADQYASYYGTDRDTFIKQSLGMTTEEFEKEAKENAVISAKKELVIDAIAKKEKIKVKKSEITDFAKENMSYYGFDSEDALIQGMGEDEIEQYLIFDKVFKLLAENAKVTEQEGASEESTTEAVTEETATEQTTAEAATEQAATEGITEAATTESAE